MEWMCAGSGACADGMNCSSTEGSSVANHTRSSANGTASGTGISGMPSAPLEIARTRSCSPGGNVPATCRSRTMGAIVAAPARRRRIANRRTGHGVRQTGGVRTDCPPALVRAAPACGERGAASGHRTGVRRAGVPTSIAPPSEECRLPGDGAARRVRIGTKSPGQVGSARNALVPGTLGERAEPTLRAGAARWDMRVMGRDVQRGGRA